MSNPRITLYVVLDKSEGMFGADRRSNFGTNRVSVIACYCWHMEEPFESWA